MNLPKLLLISAVLGSSIAAQAGETVLDNLVNPLGLYLGGFGHAEAADDFTLAPGGRVFESLTVAYAGFNFNGDETLTLRIYEMNGAPTPGSFGFTTPGNVLFSDSAPIVATPGATITFTDPSGAITLPDFIGVGFEFSGVEFDPTGAGADGGPLLYDPPIPGSSLDDYWLRGYPNSSDPWGLYTAGGNPPINLGVQITTSRVPDSGPSLLLTVAVSSFMTFWGWTRNSR